MTSSDQDQIFAIFIENLMVFTTLFLVCLILILYWQIKQLVYIAWKLLKSSPLSRLQRKLFSFYLQSQLNSLFILPRKIYEKIIIIFKFIYFSFSFFLSLKIYTDYYSKSVKVQFIFFIKNYNCFLECHFLIIWNTQTKFACLLVKLVYLEILRLNFRIIILSYMFFITYSIWKHTRKRILGNVIQSSHADTVQGHHNTIPDLFIVKHCSFFIVPFSHLLDLYPTANRVSLFPCLQTTFFLPEKLS